MSRVKTLFKQWVPFCCLFVSCTIGFVSELKALELYSLIHRGCEANTGLIIQVDEDHVYQVDIDGRLSSVPRSGIEHILVYNVIDNPFSRLDLSSGSGEYLRKVSVSADEEIEFVGWPIRFIDDLIVFFDLAGKTHLVRTDDIQRFSDPDPAAVTEKAITSFQRLQFGFGRNLPGCSKDPVAERALIQPTRMLSDQIRIQKFLSVYHNGFTRLKRLQKRTGFYARPYTFEKQTKIALVIQRDDFQEEFSAGLPVYFQWPSGSTFGPQGFLAVGLKPIEHLPSVEPIFGLRFDGKYHFLSASFAGNPFAFSAGSDFMIQNRFFMESYFAKKDARDLLFLPQFNQVALTGIEWGAYSLSAGYYYPLFGIQANGIFRELPAQGASTILKAQYTKSDYRIQVIAAPIDMGSGNPNSNNINLIYADEMTLKSSRTQRSQDLEEQIERFRFEGGFMRVNLDLDLTAEVRMGISEVIILGDYDETVSGLDYRLDFNHLVTSVNLHQNFGENVSLRGYLNYFMRQYRTQLQQDKRNHEEGKFSFSVAVEFIF